MVSCPTRLVNGEIFSALKAIVNDLKSVMTRPVVKPEDGVMTIEAAAAAPEPVDSLAARLDSYQPPEVVNLAATLNDFYNYLWPALTDDVTRQAELREQLKSIVDGRLERFSELFDVFQVKQAPEEAVAAAAEPAIVTSEPVSATPAAALTAAEQAKSVSESSRNASNMLAEKKKKCAIEELVKVPYEDHTYAISASSIALALQSSNIFNQNNAQGSSNGKCCNAPAR